MSVFVDTNVFVYARDTSQLDKHDRASAWIEHLWITRSGRLSTQVLNEYYVTVTRKLDPGMPIAQARADVEDLIAWSPLAIDGDLVRVAFAIQDSAGLAYWDALIVAAARRAASAHLLSEDLNDGQTIGGVTVVDPFAHRPGEI